MVNLRSQDVEQNLKLAKMQEEHRREYATKRQTIAKIFGKPNKTKPKIGKTKRGARNKIKLNQEPEKDNSVEIENETETEVIPENLIREWELDLKVKQKLTNLELPEVLNSEQKLTDLELPEVLTVKQKLTDLELPEVLTVEQKLTDLELPEVLKVNQKLMDLELPEVLNSEPKLIDFPELLVFKQKLTRIRQALECHKLLKDFGLDLSDLDSSDEETTTNAVPSSSTVKKPNNSSKTEVWNQIIDMDNFVEYYNNWIITHP